MLKVAIHCYSSGVRNWAEPSHDRPRCRLTGHVCSARSRSRRHVRLQLPGVAGAPSIRRSSARRRCSRIMPSASRRSKSTTPSIGCRPRSCSPAGRPARPTLLVHAQSAAAHHARCEAAALRRSAAGVLPHGADARPASSATLLFQLPPTSRRTSRVLDAFLELLPGRHARRVRVPPCVVVRCRTSSTRFAARNIALCVADSEKI